MPDKKLSEKPRPSLLVLLKSYKIAILSLVVLTVGINALNLWVPKIISHSIDYFVQGSLVMNQLILQFFIAGIGVFILTYFQSILQTYASEKVARDLREKLTHKISRQDYSYIEKITANKLLTNLTSDVDAVKLYVAQAISNIIASVFLIIGASIILLSINWKLGLAILGVIPLIGIVFTLILKRIRPLFKKAQESIDWLNKVINESILGAALIRLLNSEAHEAQKFSKANTEAKEVGLKILKNFAILIPVITFATNAATLIILVLGGHFIIQGSMSLGDFTAFNSYLAILIFPILLIGMMTNVIAQANASYQRLFEVLDAEEKPDTGQLTQRLRGAISVQNINLYYGEKKALKNVSFEIERGSKTAIIGPTAAGKTQLLYLMTGLLEPTSGLIKYDDREIKEYNKELFYKQIGFVFQDSIMFNLSVRENIAFSKTVTDESLKKAIDTAEISDFIQDLPQKLDTIISERGTSLSGGQKQRIMLARALALDPKILFLDDFTARVDYQTEKKILENVHKNYPDLTLLSVTQKINSVKDYDQIILLMEGEILAKGKHEKLIESSPEYVQIYNSQQSTQHYELHAQ